MAGPTNALEALKIERPPEPERRSRVWLWLGLVLLLGLVAAGVFIWRNQSQVAVVRTIQVRAPTRATTAGGGGATVLNSSGYVTARRRATVSSKATAKVMEVLIEEGMKVEAGQVMARMDTSNVEASLRLAQAQTASAQAATAETQALLERAELELKRIRPLAEQKVASLSELDRAEADAKSLRARLALQEQEKVVAERQAGIWTQEMEDRTVRAPFTGVVVSKDAQPGEMISPISAGGGFIRTGIGTLVDMSSLEIEVEVNESYINRVTPGQRVTAKLDAYADWEIPAKVIAIIPAADRQKATVKVRIGFEQLDPRILPDMGVKVAFRGEESGAGTGPDGSGAALSVPAAAVRKVDGRDLVWVVRDNRVERRAVKCSKSSASDEMLILAGLSAGERIVVEGPAVLAEGTRVKERVP
jgi:RND family efflux transporter MFP subunit